MIVRLVLWNLGDADLTVAQLRDYLRDESVPAFAEVPGLRLKLWISDEHTERWGAVYLFESREAADAELPSRVRELVGKEPDVVEEFDLEASIEGRFDDEMLSRRGLAYEG
ncbi:MAG: YdhR family protein [Pseudomonadota bacterium]